jgi:hypothetical protein
MAKGTSPILIAAVASAVTSAVFQIAIVVSDGWIRAHLPPYMPYLWGLCVVLWVWWAIAKFMSDRSDSAPSRPFENHGNLAGRDNTGAQISHSVIGDSALEKLLKVAAPATQPPSRLYINSAEYLSTEDPTRRMDVTECLRLLIVDDKLVLEIQNHNFVAGGKNYVPKDPHPYRKKKLHVVYSFNNGPLSEIEQLEETTLRLPQIKAGTVAPPASLHVEKPEFNLLHRTHISWQLAAPGIVGEVVLGAVAWVHNVTPDEGEKAKSIDSAIASVVYRGHNRILASVPTAYWLGESANEVDIRVGQRRGILLGILPNGLDGAPWITLENTHSVPFRPRLDCTVVGLAPKFTQQVSARIEEIEVSIVAHEVSLKKFSVFIESRGPGKRDLTLMRTI